MRKILVTAISGNVSNGILKALRESEDKVYGCDIYDYPVGMDKVQEYWKSDMAVSEEYIPNLLLKCKEYGITHLIPVNEFEIKAINGNAELFHNAGIKLMINSPFVINNFLDKYKTIRYLQEIEKICVPKTYTYDEFVEDGNQYFVKLTNSCGSKYSKIITTKAELDELNLQKDEYVIQEYLSNSDEEYTVGVFSNGTDVSTIIFKRKLEHGYTSFVELVQDKDIDAEAKMIAERIGLKGYINIQLRKQRGKNYIFEINPRISGTVYFRHMLGFTDVLWWLDLLDGKNDFSYRCNYKTAIGMRELTEKFVVLE